MSTNKLIPNFQSFGLPNNLIKSLDEVGYETPSPIQSAAIPVLLEGADLVGRAPTGTGKTAAFALPLLTKIELKDRHQQVLVLTPTRELAIQVAEAFRRYAKYLKGFQVLPVYGGADYSGQMRALKRGVHMVVGTPGRIMDHMRRGTMKLDKLNALVLDEGDEMLRMGFIDDVEWILQKIPSDRQTALFSATMPKEIQKIAKRYLNDPQNISIKSNTATAESINQCYWLVSHLHKLDALTRILEVETFDAILLFVRTKLATTQLAEKLQARGYGAEALNGDMVQKTREQAIERLKKGTIDILVATDVAARGLDVERISHVINYDIPYDTEAYIHRIGRTGRAGRTGEAILFVAPRERKMLSLIERATRQKIKEMVLPTTEMVNNQRIARFKQNITDTIATGELDFMRSILESYAIEHDLAPIEVASALAKISIGKKSLLLEPDKKNTIESDKTNNKKTDKENRHKRKNNAPGRQDRKQRSKKNKSLLNGMEIFRIEVGHKHEVKPSNIVGAIANEAGVNAEHIGHIDIKDNYSFIELPEGMPKDVLNDLKKTTINGQKLKISRFDSSLTNLDIKKNKKKNRKGEKRLKTKSKEILKQTQRKDRRKHKKTNKQKDS